MKLSLRGFRRSLTRVLLAGIGLSALAGGLAACSGGTVGTGNAPRNIVIAASGATAEQPTLQMYQCLTSGLRALLYFDDGSVGDFTSRVVWSSSNPGAVQVSNTDIPHPNGGFYPAGALIPNGTGNAIITANYYGIVSQTAVSVNAIGSIQIKAVINGDYVPLWRINSNHTSPSNAFTMGQGTSVQIAVTAMLNNIETDVTNFATLGFQQPNVAVASITQANGTASLNALTLGGPVVPEASFAPCSINTTLNPNTVFNMSVSPVQGIQMQPEFLTDPTQPISSTNPLPALFVGNSERFRVIGTLASGDTQDVSTQSTLSVQQNGDIAAFGGTSGVNNILFATAPGGVVLKATFEQGGASLTAPFIQTSIVSGVLQTFEICWTDIFTAIQSCPATQPQATVEAGTLTPVQFHAIGNFGLDGNGNAILQEVTRGATWSSTNTAIGSIGNGGNTAGQALGISAGTVSINVTDASAANIPQGITQLTVNAPPPSP